MSVLAQYAKMALLSLDKCIRTWYDNNSIDFLVGTGKELNRVLCFCRPAALTKNAPADSCVCWFFVFRNHF